MNAIRRLFRELDLWGPIDAVGEAWPFEHPCPCCGEPGPHESLRRLRLLAPVLIRRARQEGIREPEAAASLGEILSVLREWFNGENRPSAPERFDRAAAAVLGPEGTRFARDLERLRPDLEILRSWLTEETPSFEAPDPDAPADAWREFLRAAARYRPAAQPGWDRSDPERYLEAGPADATPVEPAFFNGHPVIARMNRLLRSLANGDRALVSAARDTIIVGLFTGTMPAGVAARDVAAELLRRFAESAPEEPARQARAIVQGFLTPRMIQN
jgi:hypothetical protein